MFEGVAMQRGNLPKPERKLVAATLRTFSVLLRDQCVASGLALGKVPFVRTANLVAVLNPDSIHLVVDDTVVGGIPEQAYLDRRVETPVLPLDAIIGSAVREFGFQRPIGVSLPKSALVDDEVERRRILTPMINQLMPQLRERLIGQSIELPRGYEHYGRLVPAFLRDHPHQDRNVFVMMRFQRGSQYDEIDAVLRRELSEFGLTALRADDKDYTGDLWENVCLYMLCCRFGVAVFEEIDSREFNPNIALELGFMMAHSKRCLILKDQRMPRMPTDIVAKLYKEFDSYRIAETIKTSVASWAADLGLAPKVGA